MNFSMKIGPQSTDKSKFGGFGMKIGGSATSSSARPAGLSLPGAGMQRNSAAAKAKAASGGMSSLFRESMDDEDESKKKQSAVPQWSKPTVEAMKAQREADALVAADPNVFAYDEVIDDVKRDEGIEVASVEKVRTDVNTQKKRVGLTLLAGAEQCRSGSKREAKYIEKVMVSTDRRKVEQQIVEDRLLKKEQDAREGREVFVTQAFKEELKRRKKFEDELEAQEKRDEQLDATKMEDGKGFADFHRRLLNSGMSSGRGAEKTVERAAPRIEDDVPPSDPNAPRIESKTETKEEPKEEPEEEEKKEGIKTEDVDQDMEQHGVQDVQAQSAANASAKAAKALAEQEERAEKAMSAKERFLARKRKAAEEATS